MPLARGNASPVRCAAKCSTTLRKRQHLRSLTIMARQRQFVSVIERMQQEQQCLAVMTDRKRRRGDDVTDDDDDATQGKKCKTMAEELGELKASVHHVQRQVATASRHIQELRALVHGFVEQQRRTATQTAICA